MQGRDVVLAGYVGDVAAIDEAMASHDPVIRARAIGAAERVRTRSVAARVAGICDPDEHVRRRACEIEARRPKRSVRVERALVAALADPAPLVVVAAADALGELQATDAIGALSAIARTHDDARCREQAVASLGAIGDERGLDAVLAGLADRPAIRRRCVVALAAFDGPRVEAALRTALVDHDWQVRQAAEALCDAGAARRSR